MGESLIINYRQLKKREWSAAYNFNCQHNTMSMAATRLANALYVMFAVPRETTTVPTVSPPAVTETTPPSTAVTTTPTGSLQFM